MGRGGVFFWNDSRGHNTHFYDGFSMFLLGFSFLSLSWFIWLGVMGFGHSLEQAGSGWMGHWVGFPLLFLAE